MKKRHAGTTIEEDIWWRAPTTLLPAGSSSPRFRAFQRPPGPHTPQVLLDCFIVGIVLALHEALEEEKGLLCRAHHRVVSAAERAGRRRSHRERLPSPSPDKHTEQSPSAAGNMPISLIWERISRTAYGTPHRNRQLVADRPMRTSAHNRTGTIEAVLRAARSRHGWRFHLS